MKNFMPIVMFAIASAFLIWLVATTLAAPGNVKPQIHDCGKAIDGKTGGPLVCCKVSFVREQQTRL